VLPNGMLVDYTTVLTDYFNAECNTLPFNKEATDKINDWVSRNTMEMIPRIMEDINPDATAYLINAVAFEGKWEETFEKDMISESTFTSASGETQDVTMMTETLDGFYENNLATGFMKTYEGGKYAFLAMLPKKNGDLKTFVNSLNAENYQEFLDSRDESCCFLKSDESFWESYRWDMSSYPACTAGPVGVEAAPVPDKGTPEMWPETVPEDELPETEGDESKADENIISAVGEDIRELVLKTEKEK